VLGDDKPLSFGKQGPEFRFNRTVEPTVSAKGDSTVSRCATEAHPGWDYGLTQVGRAREGEASRPAGRNEATRRYGLLLAGVTQRLVSAAQSARFQVDLYFVLTETLRLQLPEANRCRFRHQLAF